jgi:hypothetical protein
VAPQGSTTAVLGEPGSVQLLSTDNQFVVGYEHQFPLGSEEGEPWVGFGDSGAAVRDGDGMLIGMMVGFTAGGRVAWCTPWPTIEEWLSQLPEDVPVSIV